MKRKDPLADYQGPWPEKRPRAVQFFSDDYLERCREFTPAQIARFLDEFRRNYAAAEASRRKRRPKPVTPSDERGT